MHVGPDRLKWADLEKAILPNTDTLLMQQRKNNIV